jgi:DNA-binding PadR family transcriptional regulator
MMYRESEGSFMTTISNNSHETTLLGLLAKASDGRLTTGKLKEKLGKGSTDEPSASEIDQALLGLIEQGLVAVGGSPKEGPHPRRDATYRLTEQGRNHLRPARPDFPEELLRNQEAFILLQVFRARDQRLTRSELNQKLKSKAAEGQLEFDTRNSPQTIDYHLSRLVEKRCLIEHRKGVSVAYTLDPDRGSEALASAKQHDAVSFTLTGQTLNALIQAARGSLTEHGGTPPHDEPIPSPPTESSPSPLGPEEIAKIVERLRSTSVARDGLVPIHEVRRLVAEEHGLEAASHGAFDPLLKRMRSDGQVKLMPISDKRRATQEQLDASIPGVNETIFYIVE